MRKTICALAAAGLILAGGASVSADDLKLPGGAVLPLGKEVTVWQGQDSYLAPKVAEALKDPRIPEELAKKFVEIGLYQKGEEAQAKELAQAVADLLQASRVYQLRGVHGTTMYTGYVLSLPISLPVSEADRERVLKWIELYEKKSPEAAKKIDEMQGAHGEFSESFALGKKYAQILEKQHGVSKGGVSYDISSGYITPEVQGIVVPLFVYCIGTTKDKDLTVTFVFSDQASGQYFEPFLKKGVEGAK